MYSVATIITPINYWSTGFRAINAINTSAKIELLELDVKILDALSTATRGYPAMQLRVACQDNKCIFSAIFNRSINRLLELKYITRTKHRKWVYYNITMKGRQALAEINEHLIRIVQERFDKLNK